jgi:hypothetical protein
MRGAKGATGGIDRGVAAVQADAVESGQRNRQWMRRGPSGARFSATANPSKDGDAKSPV